MTLRDILINDRILPYNFTYLFCSDLLLTNRLKPINLNSQKTSRSKASNKLYFRINTSISNSLLTLNAAFKTNKNENNF